MARRADGFWTDAQNQYGAFHLADREGPTWLSGVLVVFVHGLMGDRIATWRDLPSRVLEELHLDVDVFSFSYPTSLLQRADIDTAAQDLGFVLSNTFHRYEHYLFVTHSAGGLVVKRMLCAAADELLASGNQEPHGLGLVALKARRVVNITVPHLGGTPRLTRAGTGAYRVFYALFKPVSAVANSLSFGSLGWGQNKIIAQIRHESPFLKELDEHFQARLAQFDERELPRPGLEDIYAREDIAVAPKTNDESRGSSIVARGTHGSVKLVTDSRHQLLLSVLCRTIGAFRSPTNLSVARLTILRCLRMDRELHIGNLVRNAASGRNIPVARTGTQEDALLWLCDAARPSRQVLTGNAGVGKSAVLRRAAVRMCNRYFQLGTEADLPILIPLQQLTLKLSEQERIRLSGKDLWARIAGYWCAFATRVQADAGDSTGVVIDYEWLDNRLANEPTVVSFDGVDEFLTAHPYLGLDTFGDMLSDLEAEYSANPRLFFVVSIRAIYSRESLSRLAQSSRNVFEIDHLTPEQAEAQFPGAVALIDNVSDPGLRNFLLTPLILSQLAGQAAGGAPAFHTRNEIIRAALESLIDRSGLPEIAPTSRWLDVLGVFAWIFFASYQAEMSLEDLGKAAADLRADWERHFVENPKAGARDILYALTILGNEEWLNAAAQRTIFVQTSEDQIRFVHREWQDHLLGKFLADCIRSRNYHQLAGRAFYYEPYRCASEYLKDFIITQDFVEDVVEASGRLGLFILGNTLTQISYPWIQVETNALKAVLAALQESNDLLRFAIISGISSRALRKSPTDALHPALARQLPAALKSYWKSGGVTHNNCVKSLAWCYQKANSVGIGITAPDEPWCGLGVSDADQESALQLVATKIGGSWGLDAYQRSTQIAFLALVQLGQVEIESQMVSTLHYLYPLVVAYAAGVSTHVVDEELRALFSDSGFGECVHAFKPVPELRQIWEACLQIYRGSGA